MSDPVQARPMLRRPPQRLSDDCERRAAAVNEILLRRGLHYALPADHPLKTRRKRVKTVEFRPIRVEIK